ncbi:hypothetical protein Q7P37_008559 [Cladosporium fusiforme]
MTKTIFLCVMLHVLAIAAQSSTSSTQPSITSPPEGLETSDPGVVSPNYALRGWEGCSPDQIAAIKEGFSDMITMVMGNDNKYRYPKIDWNSAAAQDYWGPAERNHLFREHITENLDRLASVTYNYWLNPFAQTMHARCDDPESECPCNLGTKNAYNIGHKSEINFCPGYFDQLTLGHALKAPTTSVWAHELMHVGDIGHPFMPTSSGIIDQLVVNWPGFDGFAAYSHLAKWVAQDPTGVYSNAVENADNYAMFVTLNYVQKQLGFYPSEPQVSVYPSGVNGLFVYGEASGNETDFDIEDICRSG